MSTSQIALLPIDPWHVPHADGCEAARRHWQQLPDYGDAEIAINVFDGPQLEIGASSVQTAICPSCTHAFKTQWVFSRLDELWDAETSCFTDLTIVLPCCGRRTSLDLICFPLAGDEAKPKSEWRPARSVGFGRCRIRTAFARLLTCDELAQFEELLGCPVVQVYTRL
ncbi:hypothetical protein ACQR1I_11180 [Bradyrhizobium sp. HKCCYLS2038]|uniref:hypothetical protein n=1 Tax=unclassified Bradyrhizobium TaxID=2631580 RepID=UPI003EB9237F